MNLIISLCGEIVLAGDKRVSEWNGKCVRVRGLETDRVQEKCRSMFGGRCFLLPLQRAVDRGTESVNNAILQKISVRGVWLPRVSILFLETVVFKRLAEFCRTPLTTSVAVRNKGFKLFLPPNFK